MVRTSVNFDIADGSADRLAMQSNATDQLTVGGISRSELGQ